MKKSMFAFLALSTACAFAVAADCYSEGIRVGVIQKFSQKGLVNKSWEGELVMEGTKIKSTGNSVKGGNVWAFSASDPAVAKVIENSTMTGNSVTLKYCQFSPFEVTRRVSFDTPYLIVQAVEHPVQK